MRFCMHKRPLRYKCYLSPFRVFAYIDVRSDAIVYVTVKLHVSQSTLVQFSTFLPLSSFISIYCVIEYEPLLNKDRNNLEL